MGIGSKIHKLGSYAVTTALLGAVGYMLYTGKLPGQKQADEAYYGTEGDEKWAKEIVKGGYILHFRHAERQKWIDVQMYDALETDLHDKGESGTRFAESEYFADAVCLNSRGKIQARAMAENIEYSKLPIGYVISSPSCRARQTAEITFGGYDELKRILVHKGPYNEKEADRIEALRKLYLSLPMEEGTNTIVSAHNSVVHDGMFENSTGELKLEEGGFYVISKKDGKLTMEHEFHNFRHYSSIFFDR